MDNWTLTKVDTLADAKRIAKNGRETAYLCNNTVSVDNIFVLQKKDYNIIIQDYNSGIKPTVAEYCGKVWVGTNFSIDCFDSDLREIRRISLLAPTYSFLYSKRYELIVAICEIDLFCLDAECKIVWHKALSDIVSEYSLNDDILTYSLFEGGTYAIDIRFG